jgi:hypothetical protein
MYLFGKDVFTKWQPNNGPRQYKADQNGIVYDPKTHRKCLKNEAITALYSAYTARFRFVSYRIFWRRNTCRVVSVS